MKTNVFLVQRNEVFMYEKSIINVGTYQSYVEMSFKDEMEYITVSIF